MRLGWLRRTWPLLTCNVRAAHFSFSIVSSCSTCSTASAKANIVCVESSVHNWRHESSETLSGHVNEIKSTSERCSLPPRLCNQPAPMRSLCVHVQPSQCQMARSTAVLYSQWLAIEEWVPRKCGMKHAATHWISSSFARSCWPCVFTTWRDGRAPRLKTISCGSQARHSRGHLYAPRVKLR